MIKVGIGRLKNESCRFSFSEEGFGFGEFYFYYDENDKLILDSEHMSKERIKKYLCVLVDEAKMED